MHHNKATLMVSSEDKTGIVASLSDMVFRYGGNILDADQHSDEDTGMFFMRISWSLESFTLDKSGIEDSLKVLAKGYKNMAWKLWYNETKQKIAIMCSKTSHCLYDLLLREAQGELDGDIAMIISNHPDMESAAKHFSKPFYYIPVKKGEKKEAEAAQLKLLDDNEISCIVLARYMQIISPEFLKGREGNIINIHHSFLPAFIGAKPYHQAKERGVKIIGATAHYVTADLDQGPIIEQDVTRITHRDSVEDMIRKGRDLERQVLSQAVRQHLQHKVLTYGNRTIIFN